jgi:hypothetical protein
MKKLIRFSHALLFLIVSFACLQSLGQKRKKDKEETSFYSIQVYHFTTASQEKALDQFIGEWYRPALHNVKLGPVGVFKPIANDTATDKRIVVITAAASLEKLLSANSLQETDTNFARLSASFIHAPYNEPPYTRYETILLQAFPMAYYLQPPMLQSPKEEHIYELRSYEGPTDGMYKNKVAMFNEGGEIELFKRLGFNAVFYGDVISGSRMPNLMYMTSFESKTARDEHWKIFGSDPFWKQLSSDPKYQHNVSKIDIILMRAASYSDY